MMYPYISALVQTLLIYIIISVAYFGWGSVAIQMLGLRDQTNRSGIALIWLGWALTLLIFQLLHFLVPLIAYVVVPIFAIGIAFAIPPVAKALRRQLQEQSAPLKYFAAAIVILVVTGWISSRAMLTPINYDSGLYHFNAIRWINSFPIVPGLGNLHGRLAFNQSFFTWVAALNFYPFFNHGRSVANSFLFLLTIATFVHFLLPVLKQPSLLIESHPFQYASVLFVLPILGYLILFSDGLPAPSPDLASTLLQLNIFIMFAQDMVEWIKGGELKLHRAAIVTFLCATTITIKLSNLVFSAVIIVIYLVRVWRDLRIRGAIRIGLPALVVILAWVCRGYVLSGAPFYPSTIGYVAADWAVPRERVAEEANLVYSWARQIGTDWRNGLANWEWLQPWTTWVLEESQVNLVYPLILAVIFSILTLISVFVFKKKVRLRWFDLVILSPLLSGLAYWFFTAPDPRFAHALFWCLSLGSALIFLNSLQPLLNKRWLIGVLCVVFVMLNFRLLGSVAENVYMFRDVSRSGWQSIKTRRLARKETSSGLVVFTPRRSDQCWDAPLPCTPYFNRDLGLRIPGYLGSGFTVTPPGKNAEQPDEPDG